MLRGQLHRQVLKFEFYLLMGIQSSLDKKGAQHFSESRGEVVQSLSGDSQLEDKLRTIERKNKRFIVGSFVVPRY